MSEGIELVFENEDRKEYNTALGVFIIAKDYRNDCYTLTYPNGDVTDGTYEDDMYDEIKYHLQMERS